MMAERIAFGHLKLSEKEFWHVTLTRLNRALEWVRHTDEMQLSHTRILAYYMGNHKAKTVEDMWMLPSEIAKRQKDILEGRVPFATFKKLTKEEIEKWTEV